jgi:hypothetical protein
MIKHTAADDAAAYDQHLHMGLHRVGFSAIAFKELWNESSASSKTRRDNVKRVSAYLPAAHRLGTERFLVAGRIYLGDPLRAHRHPQSRVV